MTTHQGLVEGMGRPPAEIAEAIAPDRHLTAEQSAVIGAGLEPTLVVLGLFVTAIAYIQSSAALPLYVTGSGHTEKVYAALNEMAAAVLATSHTVIVDAVHSAPHERAAVARIAEAAQVPFIGLWLDVPGRVLKDRVTARTGDASDATADVVARQLEYDLGDISWYRLDASGDIDTLCENARNFIAQCACE